MFEVKLITKKGSTKYRSNMNYWLNAIQDGLDYFKRTVDPEYDVKFITIEIKEIEE